MSTEGTIEDLPQLIRANRRVLLRQWRRHVKRLPAAHQLDTPTLDDHVPQLLDELADALESQHGESISERVIQGTPPAHGRQRLHDGFDIEEVVAEYNILRGCIHELAERNGIHMVGRTFHVVNRVLDQAIGLAVQTYATQRTLEVQRRRDEHLAFVAHDLRTPLNAVALATRVLQLMLGETDSAGADQAASSRSEPGEAGAKPPTDVGRMLRTLARNVKHLETLVRNVITETTPEASADVAALARRDVDVWPLVEGVVNDLAPVAATAGATLVNAVPEGVIAFADASVLSRILQNLVGNAIKYTPRGTVTVSARCIGDRGAVECCVTDDGAGIPAEQREHIFEKGVHDQGSESGFGLGLAIVKQFVEAHGGHVSVASEETVGSTFRFTLPGRPPPTDDRNPSAAIADGS